jgi:hypothetical protein
MPKKTNREAQGFTGGQKKSTRNPKFFTGLQFFLTMGREIPTGQVTGALGFQPFKIIPQILITGLKPLFFAGNPFVNIF